MKIYKIFGALAAIIIGFSVFSCSDSKPGPETWTVVQLPEGADTTNVNWKDIDLEPKPPVLPITVEEQLEKFILQPGYKMEAVLTEPQIQQPGAITFDGNGRMYVLELRSYMLTADSEGTLDPVSGISRWEDLDNDGIYETGGMFVENMVFPRFVLPFGPNAVLSMESNADNVYLYTDTDNDGKTDKKEFFTDNFGRSGNVEHQQAFLYWGMDNWLYSTVNPFRVRWTPNGVIRESTASNHAQWGITHDDDGKLWFQGGASGVPSYFEFPVHYGDYVVERKVMFAEGFVVPWGAAVLASGMQGGMGAVRMPDGNLNRVTGAAGNDIFRGHRLPDEVKGQYFYGEPVARIVRQINPVVEEGLTTLHNVYQKDSSEFIRSTDPLFRPVDMTTAPDGTMYITDMYHGIIQEGQWTPVGSYLRTKIEQYQLDKVVSLGRIWRLSHEDFERDKTQPRMYEQTSTELLTHLGHPNGWWRDMAQQVLVQRQDKSVVSQLIEIVGLSNNLLARFHALWVLEGINALESALVKELMKDPNPRMRIQAMWVSETLYKAGDKSFEQNYIELMGDDDLDVKLRAMMTGRLLKIPDTEASVKRNMALNSEAGVQLVGKQILEPPVNRSFFERGNQNLNDEEKVLVEEGLDIYNSLCSTCHGTLGTGTPVGPGSLMAPSLVGSKRVQMHSDFVIKTLLHGLQGDIEGQSYAGVLMAPMKSNDDKWIASVISFIRTNFENNASIITPEDVARVRQETEGQTKIYSYDELLATVPQILEPQPNWKVTASHAAEIRKGSTASTLGAFNFEGWTTGISQQEGMWFQIELPKSQTINDIYFVSPPIRRGFRSGSPPPIDTYPRKFNLEVSMDGSSWTTLMTEAEGQGFKNTLRLDKVEAKFIKMTLTKSEEVIHGERRGQPFDFEVAWIMREMKLYGLN